MAKKEKAKEVAKETEKTPKSKRETKSKRKEYKVGDVTAAGCKIVAVKENPEGKNGHTRILTVKCLESGKPFDIFTQDAHQTKYHPDIRAKMKRRDKKAA